MLYKILNHEKISQISYSYNHFKNLLSKSLGKKGNFYTQLSFTSISGYNTLFGDPDYNTEREISDRTLQFFTEY